MTTLYSKDVRGDLRVWQIFQECDEIVINHGLEAGAAQQKREHVPRGKAGRSLDEQIELQIQSRINRQLDKGYVENRSTALHGNRTNALGFIRPMLAMPIAKVKEPVYYGSYLQRKYDGNRCLITNRGGKIIAYSRNGKVINIPHITETIHIPSGWTIDGELYCHGERLQTIVSWIKRQQKNTEKIRFHAYDLVLDQEYRFRHESLVQRVNFGPSAEIVETVFCEGRKHASDFMANSRRLGYEGAILRQNDFGYEDGKRSKGLIKIKEWLDADCLIYDIVPSKDDWAILVAEFEGKEFRVSAPGTMTEKMEIMENFEDYLDRKVRIEYSILTKDGIPFHPVAVAIC